MGHNLVLGVLAKDQCRRVRIKIILIRRYVPRSQRNLFRATLLQIRSAAAVFRTLLLRSQLELDPGFASSSGEGTPITGFPEAVGRQCVIRENRAALKTEIVIAFPGMARTVPSL